MYPFRGAHVFLNTQEIAKPQPFRAAAAVMVKTPGLSPIKTRLAKTIGEASATDFYKRSVACIAEVLLQAKQACETESDPLALDLFYAVAEQQGCHHPLWSAFPCIHQGEGDLGERLHHIYSTLFSTHGAVLLLGGDLPHLEPHLLTNFVRNLYTNRKDFHLAPAEDGGYYLFGGASFLNRQTFTSVTYSSCETSQQFKEQLEKVGQVHAHCKNFDVDEVAELARFLELLETAQLPQACVTNFAGFSLKK